MTWVSDGSQQPCILKDDGYKLSCHSPPTTAARCASARARKQYRYAE
ncbi:Uncharacterised protein [Yersinia frederiksenii]|nr:Uncharacterised protein [Yersinia frederiksenii]CNK73725.1 Uncharacterised protein [Yersinia frederiksenii]